MIATKGLTRYAAGNRSIIIRRVTDKDGHAVRDKDGSQKQETIPVRLSDLIKDGDIAQNVELQPGDTLIIPQSWF
jgi:polysaccharide export outer membrane protein